MNRRNQLSCSGFSELGSLDIGVCLGFDISLSILWQWRKGSRVRSLSGFPIRDKILSKTT